MKYRTSNLLDAESINTAATKSIDIDTTDVISRICIEAKVTNASSTPTAHPAKVITKIEVVDGSDVLYSLSGIEAQATDFYDEGHLPFGIVEYESAVQCKQWYHVNFGRYLWDNELGLDPNRYKNLQLKITHSRGAGGSAPTTGDMSVWTRQFDEKKVNPSGFLMTKEHYAYSLTSSAVEQIDMPLDYPIRRLQVHSLGAGNGFTDQVSRLTLTEDNDKRIPFNQEYTRNLIKMLEKPRGVEEQIGYLGTGSALTAYCAPTYEMYGVAVGRSASQTTNIVSQGAGGTVSLTGDSSEGVQVMLKGSCPHGALGIPFGDQNDMTDWYDVTKLKNLKLKLTAGSSVVASSTAEVVTQQLRRY